VVKDMPPLPASLLLTPIAKNPRPRQIGSQRRLILMKRHAQFGNTSTHWMMLRLAQPAQLHPSLSRIQTLHPNGLEPAVAQHILRILPTI
jgi:hypothetical protein